MDGAEQLRNFEEIDIDISSGTYADIEELVGKIITEIKVLPCNGGLYFKTNDERKYVLAHLQSCCEDVHIEDITGDLSDLLDSPILDAKETIGDIKDSDWGVYQHCFYDLGTNKGSITIRFYGGSNGYYSTAVDFLEL